MRTHIEDVPLSREAERRYLNYALSVITSRALPDVRDGLKPVQRRILYVMYHELRLTHDHKPAKCARIVGEVMGKYHPHGDSAIYDALVRLSQEWIMRLPLVDGQGNFGSLDGDAPAAYRYTEARLHKVALELLKELGQRTVNYRPNFDSTKFEPVVLPARYPNLLVNGAQGIAVGMATSIPPHNLGEICDGLVALIDDPEASLSILLRKIKGPDFPTGGEILSSKAELKQIYESGQGSIKTRGQWKMESDRGAEQVIITAIPYNIEKHTLVEKIAEVILGKKLPTLVDVRDESTEAVRIVLELKKGANPDLVMAYLCKNTPLQTGIHVNLTCLIPSSDPDLATPRRLGLVAMLKYFLEFRLEVVTKRLTYQLEELEKRLHILDGFEKVFDALDEIIRMIRKSEGKQDAANQIMKRFKLDEEQTDAILELKLYRLARLEILVIQEEANKKRAEAKKLGALLGSKAKREGLVREELIEIKEAYGDRRRTRIVGSEEETAFTEADFIVEENAFVIVTERGWIKRQQTVRDLESTRVKEGDRILACVGGSTRSTVALLSSQGYAYALRIADVPPSTGYGDPVQKTFALGDGAQLVSVVSFDERVLPAPKKNVDALEAVAVTRRGLSFRFSLEGHREPSTRNGRRFARLNEGDDIVFATLTAGSAEVLVVASDGHALSVPLTDIPLLSGPGKGVTLIKLDDAATVIGGRTTASARDSVVATATSGKRHTITTESVRGKRGAKGKAIVKRAGFGQIESSIPVIPVLEKAP
jgi:DNA gyrase subunit A